jgi:hypothetical protein
VPEPPADPEAWTDEQWLAWLAATDGEGYGGPGGDETVGDVTRMAALAKRPAAKALGAAMIGLRNAMYGVPDDEIVAVADAGGDPPNDDVHDMYLDPDDPGRSRVVVHPLPDGDRPDHDDPGRAAREAGHEDADGGDAP